MRGVGNQAGVLEQADRPAGGQRAEGPAVLSRAWDRRAWAAAAKKNCFLKEKFWRITTKSRGKKNSALLAVAHTILRLVYEVLRTGQPYPDRQAPALSGQQKDRLIRHHVRRLGKLGVRVYSLSAGAGAQKALFSNWSKRGRRGVYFRKNPIATAAGGNNCRVPPKILENIAYSACRRAAIT